MVELCEPVHSRYKATLCITIDGITTCTIDPHAQIQCGSSQGVGEEPGGSSGGPGQDRQRLYSISQGTGIRNLCVCASMC